MQYIEDNFYADDLIIFHPSRLLIGPFISKQFNLNRNHGPEKAQQQLSSCAMSPRADADQTPSRATGRFLSQPLSLPAPRSPAQYSLVTRQRSQHVDLACALYRLQAYNTSRRAATVNE